jgi:hypothetical protein
MIRRLYHRLVSGHNWRTDSIVFNLRTKTVSLNCDWEREQMELHGFTEIAKSCACGASKTIRLIGDHCEQARSDELTELRKMVGL